MPILRSNPTSESSWIESTTPRHLQEDVSRVDDIVIEFTRMLDATTLSLQNIHLCDAEGVDTGLLAPVVVRNDYDPVQMSLTLHLTGAMEPLEQYTLIIDGLADAAGDTQDRSHQIWFFTNDSTVDLSPQVSDESVIAVIDKTISSANLVDAGSGSASAGHTVYCNPIDGAYNVAKEVDSVVISFSPNDVTDGATASLDRRAISMQETPWIPLANADTIADGKLTIVVPSYGAGYIEPGYEYRVTVTVDGSTSVHQFTGELVPMFSSVSQALMMQPGLKSYDIAKQMYINSSYLLTIDSGLADMPTKAASDYVLYSTLVSMYTSSDAASFTLGDLTVEKSTSTKDKSDKWAELAEKALAKIVKIGPRFVVKGSSNTNPHAARDWDAAGSAKRRIGKAK